MGRYCFSGVKGVMFHGRGGPIGKTLNFGEEILARLGGGGGGDGGDARSSRSVLALGGHRLVCCVLRPARHVTMQQLLPLFLRFVSPLRVAPRPLLPASRPAFFCSLAPSRSLASLPALPAAPTPEESRPRLLAPVRHLLSDAVRRGYAKFNSQGLARATSNPKFVAAPDAAIVLHYSAIIRSIVNYYSFVHSRSSLWKVTSIYRKSCALTLARKHSLRSAQAAYNKFGPHLRIATPESRDDAVVLFYPESLKTSGKFNVHSPRYSQVAILQEPFEKKRWR